MAVLVVTLCVVGLNFTALVITSSDTRPVAASSSARPASSSSGARPARANNAPQEDTIEQYRPPAFELTADAAALGQRTVSCPLYSGPGYNKLRHACREISVPAFEAPFVARPKPPEMKLEPLPPADVRLKLKQKLKLKPKLRLKTKAKGQDKRDCVPTDSRGGCTYGQTRERPGRERARARHG